MRIMYWGWMMKTIRVEITHRDPDILEQRVEDYYRDYPPPGYDTRVDGPMSYDSDRNVWRVAVTRFNSCD